MKTKNLLLLFSLLLSFGVIFSSCDDDDDKDKYQLGVFIKDQSNSWRKALTYYAEKAIDNAGLKDKSLVYTATNGTVQANQITEAYNKGCWTMVISPEGLDPTILAQMKNHGVKIVLMEEKLSNDYDVFVYTDNETVGTNAAQFMIDNDVKRVALFSVEQDPTSSSGRLKGFREKMNTTNIRYDEFFLERYTAEDGKAATLEILNLPEIETIDAIYAQDDDIAFGVLEALAGKEHSIKVIVGCGGSQKFFEAIKSTNDLTLATTLYTPKMMDIAVEFAVLLMNSASVTRDYEIDPTVVSKQNVDNHIDANSPY